MSVAFRPVPFGRERRRRADAIAKGRNGIDFVDVADDRRTLSVYFFLAAPRETQHKHYRVTGGAQVRNLRIVEVRHAEGDDPQGRDRLEIELDRPGDFSTYRLEIAGIDDFDPLFAAIDFTFGRAPGTALDCAATPSLASVPPNEPDLNYLSKDFDSFRQLVLDRFALNVPAWTEGHVPDIGITLVELLAYAGDQLSYYQDAVATEAYLDTARLRISVRRHARLVDYRVHEGCNARACVSLETDTDIGPLAAADISFTTPILALAGDPAPSAAAVAAVPSAESYAVFEPAGSAEITAFAARSRIRLYTWGDVVRTLPQGAVSATLVDGWVQPKSGKTRARKLASLKAGDLLIFEEAIGPATGAAADADPAHRAVVRLTSVRREIDPLYDVPIVEIAWGIEDALAFPLVLSSASSDWNSTIDDVTIARGNIVLVDHGQTLDAPEDLGSVPESGEFAPVLAQAGLTFREPLDHTASAAKAFARDPRAAVPQIVSLASTLPNRPATAWTAQYDLLESGPDDAFFVVEMDDGRNAHLRFGDGYLGAQPAAGARFSARYRVGNGSSGNVGAETISHMVLRSGTIAGAKLTVRNPFAATGGTDPEPIAHVKLLAPKAHQAELVRAITTGDYVRLAESIPGVFQAAAVIRWTGNRAAIRVAIDPLGTETVSAELLATVAAELEPCRRIGHDLEIVGATYVPLDIELKVTVLPDYLRGHVAAELLQAFGNGALPDGKLAAFNPQNLGFGRAVYQSRLIAAAQAVTGVQTVRVLRLARLADRTAQSEVPDVLSLGPLEVAQLDNDPSDPERGSFRLRIGGGR